MSDTISRQAAIDALQKEINKGIPPFDDVMGSIRCGVRLARNIIEDLPSAQPDIIRCKDCKHYKTHISCIGDEYSGCDYWINDGNESPCEPTDFCSYAGRREE